MHTPSANNVHSMGPVVEMGNCETWKQYIAAGVWNKTQTHGQSTWQEKSGITRRHIETAAKNALLHVICTQLPKKSNFQMGTLDLKEQIIYQHRHTHTHTYAHTQTHTNSPRIPPNDTANEWVPEESMRVCQFSSFLPQ